MDLFDYENKTADSLFYDRVRPSGKGYRRIDIYADKQRLIRPVIKSPCLKVPYGIGKFKRENDDASLEDSFKCSVLVALTPLLEKRNSLYQFIKQLDEKIPKIVEDRIDDSEELTHKTILQRVAKDRYPIRIRLILPTKNGK